MNLTVSKQTHSLIDCMVALGNLSCRFSLALEEMYGSNIIEMEEEFPDPNKFAAEMDPDLYIQFSLINNFAKTIKHTWIFEEYKKIAERQTEELNKNQSDHDSN